MVASRCLQLGYEIPPFTRHFAQSMNHAFIRILALSSLLLLVGCATSSPIKRYSQSQSEFRTGPELIEHGYPDKNIYRIYHRAATGFVSIQSIRQAAEQRAQQFCEQQGKGMVVLGEKISEPPYILGNFPRIEIVFAAIDKPAAASTGIAVGAEDAYAKIARLKGLLDDGALTQEEFDREKRKILTGSDRRLPPTTPVSDL